MLSVMFVMVTAFQYPFYGSQWHPEAVVFAWTTDLDLNHSPHAIAVSHYIANFFVMEGQWFGVVFSPPDA